MELQQLLVQEFDNEMKVTRKVLERVPMDKVLWTPHGKSRTLGALAVHVATVSRFVPIVLMGDFFEPMQGGYTPPEVKTNAELMAVFDDLALKARMLIEQTNNDELMKPFELRLKGKVLSSMPRAIAFRNFFMNHLIHHRAQLGVYLRLNDIAVPGSYGPSADEKLG